MPDEDKTAADARGLGGLLSQKEKENVQGAAAPNVVPTFAKHGGQDENNRVDDPEILENAKTGADAASPDPENQLDIAGFVQAQSVEQEVSEGNEDNVQYTSRIARYRIGRFQFEGGVLTLKGDDVGDFEELMSKASPRSQNAVRKIERAEGVRAVPMKFGSTSSRGIDTTRNGPRSPAPSQS
jgi:hypothetical protein